MKIEEIKQEMIEFRDFYGGDLINVDEIETAKTKEELADIIERHRGFMEDMLRDADNHLDYFKQKLGLNIL